MQQIQVKWSDKEFKIIKDNYGKLSYKDIQKLLPNRTIYQIRNKANYEKLCSNNNLRKYSINKEYFKYINEENCYWAGFIAADGNISKDMRKLSIKLSIKDKELLENFIKDTEYTNEIKYYGKYVSTTINCVEICEDLSNNFNITPVKSNTLIPPNLSDVSHIKSYIRGLIDGDGSILKQSIILYGTKNLLEWVKYYFDKWIPKSNYKLATVRNKNRHLYVYKISGKRAEFIINNFKVVNCYNLKRKWLNYGK